MTEQKTKLDFVRTIVADDLNSGKHDSIVTRFPPEPNGFLHIGHAKAICVDLASPKNLTVNVTFVLMIQTRLKKSKNISTP